jgi:two-component system nitrogen regulation sensor histidine kinase NtrY
MLKKSDRVVAFIAIISLMVSIGFRFFLPAQVSDTEIVNAITAKLQNQLQEVKVESDQLLKSDDWSDLNYSFFLLDSSRIVKWNRNDFLPDIRLLQDTFDIRWIHTPRGDFLIDRVRNEQGRQLVAIIPLIEQFKIANNFLNTKANTHIFPVSGIQIVDPASSEGLPIHGTNNFILFRVIVSSGVESFGKSFFAIEIFWWTGIASLLFILFRITYALVKSGKPEMGFVILGIALLTIRLLSIYVNLPDLYSSTPIFDPRVFASSSVTPSIGDLLLNTLSIVILCLYVFFTYNQWKFLPRLLQLEGIRRGIALIILASANFFIVLFPFLYYETIFHNSSITLDITQSLQFDEVRIIAFVCLILSSVSAFCFSHVFLRLFITLCGNRLLTFVLYLTLGTFIFIIYFFILERDYWITLGCSLVYFLVVYLLRLTNTLKQLSYRTFFYLLATIFLFSAQAALSIKRFVEERKIDSQFRFANEFLVGRDYLGEFLLNEMVTKIKNDPFIQGSLSNPFLSKASIKQKVRQIYLNNYFDRYDITVRLYNSVGASIDTEPFLDFASQVKSYQNQSSESSYQGIYFTSNSSESDRKYLVVIPITRSGQPVGFIVLELSVKKVIPRNVYPELLVDNRFADYRNKEYSFAIYSEGELISSSGEFNYDRDFNKKYLNDRELHSNGQVISGFIHVGVEDEGDRVAVVSSRIYPAFYLLGNFSLWIVFGFVLVLLGLAWQGIYHWWLGEQINYSARVQLYFYSGLLLPLFVVSVTTLSIITRSAADQLNQEFIDKSKLLSESLAPDLTDLTENSTLTREEFERRLREMARVSDVDATVYDSSGLLIGSSQPLIFEYQFKSELIDREALDKVTRGKEFSFVKEDQIGLLKYYSAFSAIRSPIHGQLLGIVSLPFFGSASSLEKTQITILTNILSIFTAVLLVFSVLSLLAAEQLTYPLRIIANSLSRTTLTGHNEPLAWNSNDEIGVMVNEYNRMVQNLEQSKIELARSQKESAWREMAKQVAHEIKNPLTPMKLSLQQMENLLKSEEGLPKERAERSVKTMLTQVEILNEIASSFSTFARMPTPEMTRVELNSILKKTTDLYANTELGKVNWIPFSQPLFVMGDDQLLIRIFSNIILNALQSGGENRTIVNVTLKTLQGSCLVVIEDNGAGIPEEMIDKIFVPYFSTKKSGSGLGLAIVKQGIEQSGGNVSLKSQVGRGTTFYIQFPKIG